MDNTIGTIPEFTSDETVQQTVPEQIQEEVKQEETETPALPAEKPDNQVVIEEYQAPLQDEVDKARQGLQDELLSLRKEIAELRGQKREIKQERINKVQAQIDELKDISPEDQAVMEKYIRAKGMVTKDEVQKMFYEDVKNEELNKFLDKYPEYKPENDPNDVNWQTLQRELEDMKAPTNPREVGRILEKAHRLIVKVPTVSSAPQKRQIAIASVGGGGTQKSVSTQKLSPELLAHLSGFSDEDIQLMEKKLNN